MFDGSMAMSFHSLKYPSHMMGNVHKHGILYRTMKNPILAVPPSSTLLQTDESGNLPESKNSSGSDAASTNSDSASLFINQATTVGIIGGVSVDSTLNFLKKLVQWSSKDGGDSLPFVLCSDPVLNKQLLSHERSHFPLLSTKEKVAEWIIHQSWESAKGCSVPFLHMGECVARELKNAKLKPLEAGSPLRIGVSCHKCNFDSGILSGETPERGHNLKAG
ncbi:hypothetical protein CK203_044538 [Vitis vinifera]|uniref:Uncharacterized protein n=1 Tax=Vitis vinifera TaxID=29760 RepID=A0A438HBB8_VITVI|nr:hypothetical protein CK203_044538 [Vitis vinifera]